MYLNLYLKKKEIIMSKHYRGINVRYTINFDYFKLGSAYQLHLEPNKCPSVFSKLSSRNMVVKTNIGWSFLSHLVPDNGFDE